MASLQSDLAAIRWIDGSGTAGRTAQAVKRNRQADLTSRIGLAIRDRLDTAIRTHPVILAAA